MPMICKGCEYGVRLGADYYCDYLAINKRSRQLICPFPWDDGPCIARKAGESRSAPTPQHKFGLKKRDIENVKKHRMEREKKECHGGKPLSFDADRARALYSDGLNDLEVSDITGVNQHTLKSWRLRTGIKVTRKRRKGADR